MDTSIHGIGFVLSQLDERGRKVPACYGLLPLPNLATRYGQSKLELYGLFRALKHFTLYLVEMIDPLNRTLMIPQMMNPLPLLNMIGTQMQTLSALQMNSGKEKPWLLKINFPQLRYTRHSWLE